jgi:hypothetical protein
MEKTTWAQIVSLHERKAGSLQYVECAAKYKIWIVNGSFTLWCELYKDASDPTDLEDFENNYKDVANAVAQTEVVTQLEKNDKTLRTVAIFSETDATGGAQNPHQRPQNRVRGCGI